MRKEYDVFTVKLIGGRYKICNMTMVRSGEIRYRAEREAQDGKLDNNVARAKTRIRELALCNPWEYFATLTLNKDKQDRYDLGLYHKQLTAWLRNQNRYRVADQQIRFLLIPEKHKDGAWHMHGLFHGLVDSDLYANEHGYLGWRKYEQRFGYLSLGPIRDRVKTINYITKYISKTLAEDIVTLGGHLYYRSRALHEPELIYRGMGDYAGAWEWEHDQKYCRISWDDGLAAFEGVPRYSPEEMAYTRDERWGVQED